MVHHYKTLYYLANIPFRFKKPSNNLEKKNKILIFAVSLLLDENKWQLKWDNMTKREISKLFEDRNIRTVWDDKEEAGQGTGQCPASSIIL